MIGKRYRTPEGYKWVAVWPAPRKLGMLLAGIAMIAASVLGVAVQLFPIIVEVTIALMGLMFIAWSRPGRRPGFTVDAAGRCVLRFRPVLNPQLHGALFLGAAGISMIWCGASGAVPGWFMFSGAALVAIPLYVSPFVIKNARGAYLTFDRDTFRLENRLPRIGFDREFRWDAVTDLVLERDTTTQTKTPIPIITFACPDDSVMIHASATEGRDVATTIDGRWQLRPPWFTVEPNALFATIQYLSNGPEHRANMTIADLEAMLTPPRWAER